MSIVRSPWRGTDSQVVDLGRALVEDQSIEVVLRQESNDCPVNPAVTIVWSRGLATGLD